MKKLAGFLIGSLTLVNSSAFALSIKQLPTDGAIATYATNTALSCQSKDGKVKISGTVPGDVLDSTLTVTIDGKIVGFSQQQGMGGTISGDIIASSVSVNNGVFTVSARASDFTQGVQTLSLIADPQSMTGESGVGYKVSFNASFMLDFEKDAPSCSNGCIITDVGSEQAQPLNIQSDVQVSCQASYRMN